MKYLIVNGDDYNLTDGVSQGIVYAFSKGILTSTTFMVNMPVENSLKLLPSSLSVGIHFNFTFGYPLSPPEKLPDMVDEKGKFLKNLSVFDRNDIAEQILLELESQYGKFLSFGIIPSHFDSHHHVHTRAGVKDLFFEFACKNNIPMRTLNGDHRSIALKNNIKTPGYFYDSFYGEKATFSNLKSILSELPDGISELMCHPGYVDSSLTEISSYTDNRKKELDILIDPGIAHLINDMGIKLIGYRDLQQVSNKVIF